MPHCEPPVEHQFKPGQSGNPAGKPKGTKSLTAILRNLLQEELEVVDPISKQKVRKQISEIINLKLLQKAINGDARCIQEVYDRIEGKAKQNISFGDDESGGGKLSIEIIHTNKNENQGDGSPSQESGS